MTREEVLYCMKANSVLHSETCEECPFYGDTGVDHCFEDALDEVIKALEQEPCEDCVSRHAVKEQMIKYGFSSPDMTVTEFIEGLPTVDTQPKTRWIPVSERLPKAFEFVNCTCHSLIDDREDWVVETVYVPQPQDSPYSDWGNIPMLNRGHAEVIAWMHRDIPEPYKAEIEPQESEDMR